MNNDNKLTVKDKEMIVGITADKDGKVYEAGYNYKGANKATLNKSKDYIVEALKKYGSKVFIVDFNRNKIEWYDNEKL